MRSKVYGAIPSARGRRSSSIRLPSRDARLSRWPAFLCICCCHLLLLAAVATCCCLLLAAAAACRFCYLLLPVPQVINHLESLGIPRKTRVVFRPGSPLSTAMLLKVSPESSRAIIVLSDMNHDADHADSMVKR